MNGFRQTAAACVVLGCLSLVGSCVQSADHYNQYSEISRREWQIENDILFWRFLCAAWGFAVLAVLLAIADRIYKSKPPLAVLFVLLLASHVGATPPPMIPGYVNRRQPTTHVHDEHKQAVPQQPGFAQRDKLLADATARAQQLQAKQKPGPFHVWQILGGKPNSTARIIDYHDGQVTLQKRDGTTRTFREVRMGKVDRACLETWKKQPPPRRVTTFRPI